MFKEQVTHAFKEMRGIKVWCNFLIMKPEGIKKQYEMTVHILVHKTHYTTLL
jgi:hypothetical protein